MPEMNEFERAVRPFGLHNYDNFVVSGEQLLLRQVLAMTPPEGIIIDVGANRGDWTAMVLEMRSDVRIIAIEPNPHACAVLRERFAGQPVEVIEAAAGQKAGRIEINYPMQNLLFAQVSSNREWVQTNAPGAEIVTKDVAVVTIDDIIDARGIQHVAFVKIDTEGAELDAINGLSRCIAAGRSKIIQFEFGEVFAMKRIFLRDFIAPLKNYKFMRLSERGLIDIGDYKPKVWEIFCYQNIAAIHKSLVAG